MQIRHRHFIRPVSTSEYPTCVIAVSAESESGNHSETFSDEKAGLKSWYAETATLSYGIQTKQFASNGYTTHDWWRFLDGSLKYHRDLWVVSMPAWHTMKLLGIEDELTDQRSYLVRSTARQAAVHTAIDRARPAGYLVLENPPTIIKFKRQGQTGTVTWIDMRNFVSLELTGIESVSILSKLLLGTLLDITSFLRENNLGSLRVTTASQALYAWKYRFLRHSVHVSTNEAQNTLASDALMGGRCECYRIGVVDGPITQFDFNSLYPSVYVNHDVPVRLRRITCSPSRNEIAFGIGARNCIARIEVETDVPNVPKRDELGTYFPIGKIKTAVCWPELEIILDTARRIRITEIATYDLVPTLREFGHTLYQYRQKCKIGNTKALESYVKALLVSLPGKFGQRQKRWQVSDNQICAEPWSEWHRQTKTGALQRCRSIGWTVEEEVESSLASEAVPEIAAWVNSWGRRILWEEMCYAGRNQVCYCDTDSVWTYGVATARISGRVPQNSGEMGVLRRVGDYHSVEFRGIKHYVADGKLTCAGLPRRLRLQRGTGLVEWSPTNPAGYNHGTIWGNGDVTPLVVEDW